jgi:hypothetical protein
MSRLPPRIEQLPGNGCSHRFTVEGELQVGVVVALEAQRAAALSTALDHESKFTNAFGASSPSSVSLPKSGTARERRC